jgi:hypothetical protein
MAEVQPPFEEAHSGLTAAAASLSSSKPPAGQNGLLLLISILLGDIWISSSKFKFINPDCIPIAIRIPRRYHQFQVIHLPLTDP